MPWQSRHPVDQCCTYVAVESVKIDEHLLEGGLRGASVPRRATLDTVAVYHKKAVTVLVLEGRNPSRGGLVQGLQAAHGQVEQVHLARWGENEHTHAH
jgi:hypothetical protein